MVACMTLITFLTRGFFLLIAHHAVIPQRVQRALRYAPAAALAAIIVPDLVLGAGGALNIGLDNPG
ncbi:MAG: AzlD domain-containing protein [Candidatus Protistobacter heckmanni]|nr:AzlD domain-containing protein [Candidatus Protistobacter heckmanni]